MCLNILGRDERRLFAHSLELRIEYCHQITVQLIAPVQLPFLNHTHTFNLTFNHWGSLVASSPETKSNSCHPVAGASPSAFKFIRNQPYPKSTEPFSAGMRVLFVQEHFGLWSGRFLRSHYHFRLLSDVIVQQLTVRRHAQLSLHPFMFVPT